MQSSALRLNAHTLDQNVPFAIKKPTWRSVGDSKVKFTRSIFCGAFSENLNDLRQFWWGASSVQLCGRSPSEAILPTFSRSDVAWT